jgi:hypothetical protein
MARRREPAETLDHTIPLRITPSMNRRVKRAATRLHYQEVETMRTALSIGLGVMEALGYDLHSPAVAAYLQQRLTTRTPR